MMPKINVMLESKAHDVLFDYKRSHKVNSLDDALNALLLEYDRKSQLFR